MSKNIKMAKRIIAVAMAALMAASLLVVENFSSLSSPDSIYAGISEGGGTDVVS